MAKEDINTANGCDEVGMSNANIEGLDGVKRTYAVQNRLLRSIIGNDMFEKSWKALGVREYADRIGLFK